MSFFPLDRAILTSSLWAQGSPAQFKVWVYLLLNADPRTGIVPDADPAIAARCVLSLEDTTAAMDWLSNPDPYSRTADNDGRRIERTKDGRVRVLNYAKHRDKDHSTQRVRKWRDMKRGETVKRDETEGNGVSPYTETTIKRKRKRKQDLKPLALSRPAYWDNATQNLVVDHGWLSEQIREYEAEVGHKLNSQDWQQRLESIRRELLRDPRLRACIVKRDGTPSSDSQFRRLESFVVSRFKETVQRRSEPPPWKKPLVDESAVWTPTPEEEAEAAQKPCNLDHRKPENRRQGRTIWTCVDDCGWSEPLW